MRWQGDMPIHAIGPGADSLSFSSAPSTPRNASTTIRAHDTDANDSTSTEDTMQPAQEYQERIRAKLAAQRRRHAKEELQRVRRKQQALQFMRKRVEELQKEYEELCQRADFQVLVHKQKIKQPQTTQQQVNSLVRYAAPTSESTNLSLWCLAREVRHLEQENTMLRELMDQRKHFEHVMRTMLVDDGVSTSSSSFSSWQGAACGTFGGALVASRCMGSLFPLTMDDCNAIIEEDYKHYVVRNLPDFFDEQINQNIRLGWKGFVRLEDQRTVHFQLTKRRPLPMHVDFSFLVNLYWNCITGVLPMTIYSSPVQNDIVQRLSNDAVVVRRFYTNVFTGKILRVFLLMYRMQLGSNLFLISGVPLPNWKDATCWTPDLSSLCPRDKVQGQDHGAKMPKASPLEVEPLLYRFHSLLGPAEEDKVHGRVSHVRFCSWGTTECCSPEEAELLANEVGECAVGFENLIAFQCDRKLIE